MKKRLTILLLFIFLIPYSTYANLNLINRENISGGVVKTRYTYQGAKGKTRVYILECNLSDPDLDIDIITGKGKYTQRATVSEMANTRNALATVNGDFFNMALQGTPEGPSMRGGVLLSSPSVIKDVYSIGITNDMTADILRVWSQGGVTAPNGKKYPISGLNRSYYWYDTTNEYSHENKINLYDSMWASKSRGDKKNAEVLLDSNYVVEQISDKNFPFAVPEGKYILQLDGLAKDFFNQNIKVGDQLKIDYTIYPRNDYKMLIGGHGLLVDNGQAKKYTKDVNVLGGFRARTAVGISKDGKTLYILSAEGRTKRSYGLSLNDMSKIFVELKAFKAVNLDGGGSTAMVAKELGSSERTRFVNPERNGPERRVVNGIGLFNKAQPTGIAAGVKISGPSTVFVGENAQYGLKSVWDTAYQPMDKSKVKYSVYDLSGQEEFWNNDVFSPMNPGKVDIGITTSEGAAGVLSVDVLGLDKLKSLIINRDKVKVAPGEELNVKFEGVKPDGSKFKINPSMFIAKSDSVVLNDLGGGKYSIGPMNKNISKVEFSAPGKTGSIILLNKDAEFLRMVVGSKDWEMNGIKNKMDVSPFIKNSRTLVPLRFVVEALKGEVDWNPETKTATIKIRDKNIEIPIDSKKVMVNGVEKTIDQAAIISNSRTFVPIRFISETVGMEVIYLGESKEIYIVDSNGVSLENNVDNNVENTDENQNENSNNNSENTNADNNTNNSTNAK